MYVVVASWIDKRGHNGACCVEGRIVGGTKVKNIGVLVSSDFFFKSIFECIYLLQFIVMCRVMVEEWGVLQIIAPMQGLKITI
jgi:hypothetical protein